MMPRYFLPALLGSLVFMAVMLLLWSGAFSR